MIQVPPDVTALAKRAYVRWLDPSRPTVLIEDVVAAAIMEDRVARARSRALVGLTPRQRDALDFITKYAVEHGYSPAFSEIRDAIGLASKSGVNRIVNALVERGHLVRTPFRARALGIVDPMQTRVA